MWIGLLCPVSVPTKSGGKTASTNLVGKTENFGFLGAESHPSGSIMDACAVILTTVNYVIPRGSPLILWMSTRATRAGSRTSA